MRRIFIIGIGAGDPRHMTMEAIEALRRADVVFIPDKGAEKGGLRQQRLDIVARFAAQPRVVTYQTPARPLEFIDYKANVAGWHAETQALYQRLIADELSDAQSGAFLVWGDPALFDSAMRIVEVVHAAATPPFDYEIVSGISSIQALAAKHRVTLNRIGESVLITTGRKLVERFPEEADSIIVMLDGIEAFAAIDARDLEIYWGANIGTPHEALLSGRLAEVRDKIKALRAKVRRHAGFVMDVYLLRKPASRAPPRS